MEWREGEERRGGGEGGGGGRKRGEGVGRGQNRIVGGRGSGEQGMGIVRSSGAARETYSDNTQGRTMGTGTVSVA